MKVLTEFESGEFLRSEGIRVCPSVIASSVQDASRYAGEMGYPVVLKVSSPDIPHKSDVGGVRVGIRDEQELGSAWRSIMAAVRQAKPDARIQGMLVQKMAESGLEVVVGAFRDAVFGPVVMFGLGGIFVEVFKDVSFRLAPVSRDEALEMAFDVRGSGVLSGVRGRDPRDLDSLADLISKLSMLICRDRRILEIDLNPVVLYERGRGYEAVDALVTLKNSSP